MIRGTMRGRPMVIPVENKPLHSGLDRLNIMISFRKPMSEAGLRQFISKALDKGFIREGFHSEVERAERNISDEDIQYGLSRKNWVIEREPEQSKTGGFKYLIRTVDIEQEELHLLVKPDTETGTLKVLTKY